METLALAATTYCPTSPRTGLSGQTILRAKNVILTGQSPDIYLQAYQGSLNLNETIPTLVLSGTLNIISGETTVNGSSTSFTSELRSGQQFFAGGEWFMVNAIIDDVTLTVYQGPVIDLLGVLGYRAPVLFEINRQRGTQIQGNSIYLDKGSILGTGYGTLRLNGNTLQGGSLVFSDGPKIALFDPAILNYAVYDVGFDTPTIAPTLSESLGTGTKGMVAGEYSLRFVPSSGITGGYSNPGPRANVTLTLANSRIAADFTLVPMDTAAGQDQWDAYGTQLGVVQVNQGPWNFIRSITAQEIADGGGTVFIEYLNAEIARQGELEFDNDPPPNAGFVTTLQGYPQWVSCFGKWGNSPGPSLVPAVPQNVEGAPEIWNVTSSPPEDILGVITSLARLYLLCAKTLQQGIYAPTGDPLIPPTQIRPYWHMGFGNPQQLIFAAGVLIGYTTLGPMRSTADVEVTEEQFLGAHVAEVVKDWTQAHVLVAYDPNPLVNACCFFYPNNGLNDNGYQTTRVLLWGFNQQDWIGDVVLSSTTRDMIVTSVATIDNQLYFLAGQRLSGGVPVCDTFKWNVPSGDPVDYYAAWEVNAGGMVDRNKSIKAARASGRFNFGQLQIYTYDSNEAINLDDLAAGLNSAVTINLGTTTDIETTFRERINAPNAFLFTARISGRYSGTDTPDQINGVVLEYMVSSVRR